jgi:glycine/D-amino acid oxidase-like deaminating enzyme
MSFFPPDADLSERRPVTSTQQTLRLGQPVWMRNSTGRKQRYHTLSGHHETSVAIVGGGMTGALVAHAFASAGVATVLLEAGLIARGSTAASSALLLQEPDLELGQLRDRLRTVGRQAHSWRTRSGAPLDSKGFGRRAACRHCHRLRNAAVSAVGGTVPNVPDLCAGDTADTKRSTARTRSA